MSTESGLSEEAMHHPGSHPNADEIWNRVNALHTDEEWTFDAAFEAVCMAFDMGDRWDQDASGEWILVQALAWYAHERKLLIDGARKAVHEITDGNTDAALRSLGFPLAVVDDPWGDQ